MGNLFDEVAVWMTKTDKGGEAGKQLNIAEARQGLSKCFTGNERKADGCADFNVDR